MAGTTGSKQANTVRTILVDRLLRNVSDLLDGGWPWS
jgi:hypothetical protein